MDEDRIVNGVVDSLERIDNAINVITNMMTKNKLPISEQLINPLIETSITIALLLVTAYWLVGFINELTEMDWRHLSIWWYVKKIVQLILAEELIIHSPDLCNAIFDLVNWMVQEFQLTTNIPKMIQQLDKDQFRQTVEGLNLWDRIMFNVELQTPKLVLMAVAVVVQLMAWIRVINIAILQILAPIRLSTVVNRGVSGAYSFFQDYVGEVGQVLIIFLGLKLYSSTIGDMMLNVGNSSTNMVFKMLLSSVCLLVVILGAVPIAKKLIGR